MKSSGSGGDDLNSEINITPFVDVLLVLMIIFMITAPMMTTGVSVNLPQVTSDAPSDKDAPLVLSIEKGKGIFLAGTAITWNDLPGKLSTNPEVKAKGLYVQADTDLPYGVVVTAMAIAKTAGVEKVMFLTSSTDVIDTKVLDAAVISGKAIAPEQK